MRERGACAVIATVFADEAELLRPLLEKRGFPNPFMVCDGLRAMRLVRDRLPGLLLIDAVLPGMDGVELAERTLEMPLAVHPATLLLTVRGMAVRHLPTGSVALEKPVHPEKLDAALAQTLPERRRVPPEKRFRAEKLLDSVGIPRHCGRDYLLRAIEMAWMDERMLHSMTGRLVPAVAETFGRDCRHVERAMRHVIDVAWRGGEFEAQNEIFGNTIDAKRGNPTCSEMIARIADILRWEGRA